MTKKQSAAARAALDSFALELPGRVFADAGGPERAEAAVHLEDKLADAGQVHRLTGFCPSVAVEARGDFEPGADPRLAVRLAASHGIRIGSIDPALSRDPKYRSGSLVHDDPAVRQEALRECFEAIQLGRALKADIVSLRLVGGIGISAHGNFRTRKQRLEDGLLACHRRLGPRQTLLLECRPAAPAHDASEVADWASAWFAAVKAGLRAKLLVDASQPAAGRYIEQTVAFLLAEDGLGGLGVSSLDPHQVFRLFHEILTFSSERGTAPRILFRIEPAPGERPTIEALLQTALLAQEIYVKAALVDRPALLRAQAGRDGIAAESALNAAFFLDAGPAIADWRRSRGLTRNPLAEHRRSGYEARVARDRSQRRAELRPPRADGYV